MMQLVSTSSIICPRVPVVDKCQPCHVTSSYCGFIHASVCAKFEVRARPRDYSSAITTFNPVIPLFSQPFLLLHVKYKDGRIIERAAARGHAARIIK